MATNSAPVESSKDSPVRGEPSHRPLWQAPVFVLGVAVLVGMATARPFAPPSPSEGVARELLKARQILARPDGDVEHALKLARHALEEADQFPEHIATAAFLLGTAHMRLAEKAEGPRAVEAWQRAGQFLEQAQKEGMPDEDQPALMYRLGKVGFHNGDNVKLVIERLKEAVPRVDTRAEGYRLLSQAYLRLNPPNLNEAYACNLKLRDEQASEEELFAAKLVGGELLLRMGKPAEARQTLEKIGNKAPPAILVRARLLQARSYQDEKQWRNATTLYEIILADQQRAPIPEPAQLYYNLGLCYRELDQPQEAAKALQRCIELARGEEGPAAAIDLANLKLLDVDPAAVDILTRAVEKVRTPADWTNKLIDVGKAVSTFEKAAQVFRERGKHPLAWQLLAPYQKLASPFKVLLLRGDIAAEWAAARAEKIRTEGRRPTVEEERANQDLYVKAGEAYSEAAALPGLSATEQGQYLWQSATAYLAAQNPVKAADQLEKFVKLNLDANKLGEAYYRLGEVYRNSKDMMTARTAYDKCLDYATPFAYLARYQVAMLVLESGRVDEAEAFLVDNLKKLRFDGDNLEALGQTLFALGNMLYQRRDYRRVVGYLDTALGKFKDSPQFKDNAEVTQARYQLADSYRQLASLENQDFSMKESMSEDSRALHMKEYHRLLRLAAEEFTALDAFLDTPNGKDHLSRDQRSQVPLITAKCWFNLGQYDKALKVYERVIERCPDQVEGLDALGGAVSCHAALGEIDKVRARLLQIKFMLPKMPNDVRIPWEKWLEAAIKPLQDLERENERIGAASANPVGQ